MQVIIRDHRPKGESGEVLSSRFQLIVDPTVEGGVRRVGGDVDIGVRLGDPTTLLPVSALNNYLEWLRQSQGEN